MIRDWLIRLGHGLNVARRDPLSLFPRLAAMRQRGQIQAWQNTQNAAFRALEGMTVEAWAGFQWAIDDGDGGPVLWSRADIPWLQFDCLYLKRAGLGWLRIRPETGEDDNWPIGLTPGEPLPPDPAPTSAETYAWRRVLHDLPHGEITCVALEHDLHGAIIGLRLGFGEREVTIRSGELMPDYDDVIRINFEDEFLLVQVDGRLPATP